MLELRFTGGQPQRLDAFLQSACPGLSGGELHKYLRQNKIKLNGKRLPLSTQLSKGDLVRLYLPGEVEARAQAPKPPGPLPAVLFEDENLLALYKPAGLVSESEDPGADSLLARAAGYLGLSVEATPAPPSDDTLPPAPLLCHRLDTGTSGVILLAKNQPALLFVQNLLREGQLKKTYLCAATGCLQPPQGLLKGYLAKDPKRGVVRVFSQSRPGAKQAETAYRTLAAAQDLSLLELYPHTGRTHQLRVQLAHAGHPILGDSKYGKEEINRAFRCRYQCLSAISLRFPSSVSGEFSLYASLEIQAPEPWFLSFFAQERDT